MITIKIPNNNIPERTYILDIVFNEFLGLEYSLEIGSSNYEIILPNKKVLTIKDTFFNKFPNDLEYLKEQNIPKSIKDLDIFSACFFMLTRWEEYVNKTRDNHNRFPAYESLAYKQCFLDKPIVNEIIEDLKKQLLDLDNSLNLKEKKFELILTHDVDEVKFWQNKKQLFRMILGDIVKRKNIKLAFTRIAEYFLVKENKINDPYDTFDWLMDKSEAMGVKSRFYFMSGGVTSYDNRYDITTQKSLIEKIKNRGHIIGIHPSYNAYNDINQLKKEKDLLEKVCECKIVEGREHYLRFEVPTTWQIWEDNGLEVDSTCGYAESEGFRCGTGDEFRVFNILTREKLNLKERPLVFMDDNHHSYNDISFEESFKRVAKLIEYAKVYNMKITLLFHNSIFTDDKNINFKKLNEKLLELV
jgi:hypothetical protein